MHDAAVSQYIESFYKLRDACSLSPEVERDVRSLIQDGYGVVGSGFYSIVLVKKDRAVKLGLDGDGGYAFAEWVRRLRKPSPHFPKIYDIKRYLGTRAYRVDMERLRAGGMSDDVTHRRARHILEYGKNTQAERSCCGPELVDACRRVRRKFLRGPFAFDFHRKNYMIRPWTGEFVIIDPIAGEYPYEGEWSTRGQLAA